MAKTNKLTNLGAAIDAQLAIRANGPWYPACGGTEVPFLTRGGVKVLYMWQPSTGRHAYYRLDTDLFIDDAELELYGL